MKLTQNEFNHVLDLLTDAVIANAVVESLSKVPIDKTLEESDAAQAVINYHAAITTLYKKHIDSNMSHDAHNIYINALQLATQSGICRTSIDSPGGIYKITASLSYRLYIDNIQKQLNLDFSSDSDEEIFSPLAYTGKYPATSGSIFPSISFARSGTLYR